MPRGPRHLAITIRGSELDALRRRLSLASISLTDRLQGLGGGSSSVGAAEHARQHRRDAPGSALPDDARPRAARNHTAASPEWPLSVSDWVAELSRCDQPPALPAACRATRTAQTPGAARSIPAAADRPAAPSNAAHLRRGLYRLGGVRDPGTGASRVQPPQATAALRITRCCISRARARTFGMANCGPAIPIPPAGCSICSMPASPRCRPGCDW